MRLVVSVIMIFMMTGGSIAQALAAEKKHPYAYEELDEVEEIKDPLEPLNRKIYGFNKAVDNIIFKPVAKTYQKVVPHWGKERIGTFLRTLATPITFFNSLLQGDIDHAFTAFWRFTLNATFGLGGVFDFADLAGLKDRKEDFGQTLGTYGIPGGPYLVLPLVGPSNPRDAFGKIADSLMDPFNHLLEDEAIIARHATEAVHHRAQALKFTDDIEKVSLDGYATIRSLYLQNRQSAIHNGNPSIHQY